MSPARPCAFPAIPPQSLPARQALLNALTVGLVQLVLGLLTYGVRERYHRAAMDERLSDVVAGLAEGIDIAGAELLAREAPSAPRSDAPLYTLQSYFWQLRRDDGQPISRSPSLEDLELPLSAAARDRRRSHEPFLETLTQPELVARLGRGHQLRVATLHHTPPAGAPYIMQVADSLESVDAVLSTLRQTILLLLPIGLIVAAAASWALVSRTLLPIGQVIRESRQITATELGRRLAPPSAANEVHALVQTLNGMLERLESAFQAQERFVANAARELKTPVTHLLGQAQVLLRQPRALEEHQRFAASVEAEMRSLAQLVESLLLLARTDAGMPLADRRPASLNEIVVDAIHRCRADCEARGVRIDPTLVSVGADEDEPEVLGDHELLVAAIANLIRNAVRHSPAGQRVQISASVTRAEATISVRDHGPGIPPDQLARVFQRFFQTPRPGSSSRGTGLGLAITQSIARLHGGAAHLANAPGGGCEAAIRLPLANRREAG